MSILKLNANATAYESYSATTSAEPYPLTLVGIAGSSVIQDGTNPRRTSRRSYKFVPSANLPANLGWNTGATAGALVRFCFGFRIETAPQSGKPSDLAVISVQGQFLRLRLFNDLTLQLIADATQVGSTSGALSLNTWYQALLEVQPNAAGTNKESSYCRVLRDSDMATMFEAQDLSNWAANTTASFVAVGRCDTPSGETTPPVIRATDLVIMDNQGSDNTDRPSGLIHVDWSKPNAEHTTREVWTDGGGGTTGLQGALDNAPPTGTATGSNGTQIEHLGGGTNNDDYDVDCETYKDAGVSNRGKIRGVLVFCRHGEYLSSGTKTGHVAGINGNPTISATTFTFGDDVNATLNTDATGTPNWRTKASAIVDGSALTTTSRPRLQIRRTDTAGTDVGVDQGGFMFVWEKPNFIPATEADVAQALTKRKQLALTPVTETDSAVALSVSHPQRKTLTPATETDAAQALSITHAIHAALTNAAETDAAVALSKSKLVALVSAAEADAAQALTATKTIYKSLTAAAEADSGQALDIDKHAALSIATESDAAQALVVVKTIYKALSSATETDSAQALTVSKRASLVVASEVDEAQTLAFIKTIYKALTPGVEVDQAQALSVTKTIQKALSAALETDSAVVLSAHKTFSLTPATEADSAQALVEFKVTRLVAATETDTAVALVIAGVRTLVAAGETDVAVALTELKRLSLTPASETDAAQALSERKYATLQPAIETDSAQSLVVTKTIYKSITPAGETDLAQEITYAQASTYSIVAATETDAAQALVVVKTIYKTIDPAGEVDSAVPFAVTTIAEFDPASESDSARALTVFKRVSRTPASESDSAQALVVRHRLSLTPAGESDSAQALTFTQEAPEHELTPATETDRAVALTVQQPTPPEPEIPRGIAGPTVYSVSFAFDATVRLRRVALVPQHFRFDAEVVLARRGRFRWAAERLPADRIVLARRDDERLVELL